MNWTGGLNLITEQKRSHASAVVLPESFYYSNLVNIISIKVRNVLKLPKLPVSFFLLYCLRLFSCSDGLESSNQLLLLLVME